MSFDRWVCGVAAVWGQAVRRGVARVCSHGGRGCGIDGHRITPRRAARTDPATALRCE